MFCSSNCFGRNRGVKSVVHCSKKYVFLHFSKLFSSYILSFYALNMSSCYCPMAIFDIKCPLYVWLKGMHGSESIGRIFLFLPCYLYLDNQNPYFNYIPRCGLGFGLIAKTNVQNFMALCRWLDINIIICSWSLFASDLVRLFMSERSRKVKFCNFFYKMWIFTQSRLKFWPNPVCQGNITQFLG